MRLPCQRPPHSDRSGWITSTLPHVEQALEPEDRVERLAGRDGRDGTRLPQTRIAVEVLGCERLLLPQPIRVLH